MYDAICQFTPAREVQQKELRDRGEIDYCQPTPYTRGATGREYDITYEDSLSTYPYTRGATAKLRSS